MGNNRKAIYPLCARSNWMVSNYSDIAVDNYQNAKSLYKEIELANFNAINMEEQYHKFCHSIVISIVFSAMAIEAFVNNYGAVCLGDDFFYENFDRLSVISKMQLISKFLFHENFDKSKEYYYCLKNTFSERDKFVHSKTISTYDYCNKKGYVLHNDLKECIASRKELLEDPVLDKDEMLSDLKLAFTAIKAMKNIAEYFDENDSNVYAIISFFHVGDICNVDYSKYHQIYKELGII